MLAAASGYPLAIAPVPLHAGSFPSWGFQWAFERCAEITAIALFHYKHLETQNTTERLEMDQSCCWRDSKWCRMPNNCCKTFRGGFHPIQADSHELKWNKCKYNTLNDMNPGDWLKFWLFWFTFFGAASHIKNTDDAIEWVDLIVRKVFIFLCFPNTFCRHTANMCLLLAAQSLWWSQVFNLIELNYGSTTVQPQSVL